MTTTTAIPTTFTLVTIVTKLDGQVTEHTIAGQPLVPGLAITPTINGDRFTGGWTVTHTASGWQVIACGACLTCVRLASLHLTERGVDWTREQAALTADDDAKAAAERFQHEVTESCDGANCPWPIEVA